MVQFRVQKRFFLNSSLIYSTKGKILRSDVDPLFRNQVTYKYLEMPILYTAEFKGTVGSGREYKWYFGAGPNISYWLGGKGRMMSSAGLTVVRRLVELHQGRVEAVSDGPGRGAEFRVYLPCVGEVQADEAVPQPAPDAQPALACGKRVLVVDDNIDAAESVAMLLRLDGHEVKVVTDGPQALAALPVFAPQVAVLDIGLPGMNGYELAGHSVSTSLGLEAAASVSERMLSAASTSTSARNFSGASNAASMVGPPPNEWPTTIARGNCRDASAAAMRRP